MAPWTAKAESAPEHDQDLSTLLTSEERVELTLLIANITQLMQKQITDTFDASITTAKKPEQALNITDKNPNVENVEPHEETEEEERTRKMREKREKELSAPKMLELKKDALQFFEKWQDSVITRVGTVVNKSTEVAEEQKEKASSVATPETAPPPDTKVVSKSKSALSSY